MNCILRDVRHLAGCPISDPDFCTVERGELTTHEGLIQGCGSTRHDDDDDEPRRVSPAWPLGEAGGFKIGAPVANEN
jgi:hypothetical protein